MERNVASPQKAALYGIIFWFVLYLLFPISYSYPFSLLSISLLFFSYLFFFLGYNIGGKVKLLKLPIDTSKEKKGLFYFFFMVSFFSVLLILLDKFYIRGISIGNAVFDNRGILKNTPPSLVGVLGNVFKAGVFMSIYLYYKLSIKKRVFIICTFLFLLYFILESFVLGSRSTPVFYIILTTLILLHFGLIKIQFKYLVLLGVLGVIFFIILTEIFIARTQEFAQTRERAIEHILIHGSYLDYTYLDKEFIDFVLSIKAHYIQTFFVGVASFVVYYLHSVAEFSYLIDHFDSDAQLGSHTFFVISKFFKIIFGFYDGQRSLEYIPRLGKYTTFFGEIYMDFKYLTVVFMFLFGFWQARIYKAIKVKNHFTLIPLILFFCILNFVFPVFNLISGGNGIYLIIGFLIISFMYKFLSCIKISKRSNIQ